MAPRDKEVALQDETGINSPDRAGSGGEAARPRAADDFGAIHARLAELRLERARAGADGNRVLAEPQTRARSAKPASVDRPRLLSTIQRAWFKVTAAVSLAPRQDEADGRQRPATTRRRDALPARERAGLTCRTVVGDRGRMTHPGTGYPQGDNGSGNEDQLSHDHLQLTTLQLQRLPIERSAELRRFNLSNN
jgi:hypothetical protein